jgi:putative ABC transport system ATP-binding protein
VIVLSGVSKKVPSGDRQLTILHPLDLFVPSGQFLSIVGPSGSGKSTLLGLIAGLDTPSTGRIVIDGEEITSLDEERLARLRGDKIGFVFQFFHLIPEAAARAERRLNELGLADRLGHYPSQLSGGEQQRVAVARALANDPPILLADEPTGNLDSENGRHLVELLTGIHRARGTTLVLATHDLELAAQADVVLALRGGRVEPLSPPQARSLTVVPESSSRSEPS